MIKKLPSAFENKIKKIKRSLDNIERELRNWRYANDYMPTVLEDAGIDSAQDNFEYALECLKDEILSYENPDDLLSLNEEAYEKDEREKLTYGEYWYEFYGRQKIFNGKVRQKKKERWCNYICSSRSFAFICDDSFLGGVKWMI